MYSTDTRIVASSRRSTWPRRSAARTVRHSSSSSARRSDGIATSERACEGLTKGPSRRTRISVPLRVRLCAVRVPTAAPRCSPCSMGRRADPRPRARRRLRRRRHAALAGRGGATRSSPSTRRNGSRTRASGSAASAAMCNMHFLLADGTALPFPARGVRRRVVARGDRARGRRAAVPAGVRPGAAPGGCVYLSTAPYLSFAGAHLPRLKCRCRCT